MASRAVDELSSASNVSAAAFAPTTSCTIDAVVMPRRMLYVIEHMEEELSDWVICEYKRMVRDVGAENLVFTNMKPGVNCPEYKEIEFLHGCKLVPVPFESFYTGSKARTCLLDEKAKKILCPSDQGEFDYFLFGGILGNVDDMDMDRTKELRVHAYATRHLGKEQMTTPTALDVTFRVLDKQQAIESMQFVDRPEFDISDQESLMMPFKYLANTSNEPIMAEGILDLLKQDTDWDLSLLM